MSECKAKKMKIDPTLMSFEAKKDLLLHVSQHLNACFYFTPLDWSDQELSTKATFSFFGTFYFILKMYFLEMEITAQHPIYKKQLLRK